MFTRTHNKLAHTYIRKQMKNTYANISFKPFYLGVLNGHIGLNILINERFFFFLHPKNYGFLNVVYLKSKSAIKSFRNKKQLQYSIVGRSALLFWCGNRPKIVGKHRDLSKYTEKHCFWVKIRTNAKTRLRLFEYLFFSFSPFFLFSWK